MTEKTIDELGNFFKKHEKTLPILLMYSTYVIQEKGEEISKMLKNDKRANRIKEILKELED